MNNLVITPLKESGVDGTHGDETLAGQLVTASQAKDYFKTFKAGKNGKAGKDGKAGKGDGKGDGKGQREPKGPRVG